MAFRRSVSARAKLFYQQQPRRAALPLSRIDRDDNDRRRQGFPTYDLRRGGNVASFSFSGSRSSFGDRRFVVPAAYAPVFVRNMSSSAGEGRAAEILMNEGVKKAMEEVSPLANETAAGTAMDLLNADALHLQHLTSYLDTLTSFHWCASIALGTVFIRTLLLPRTIHRIKTDLIKSQMVKIEEEMKSSDKSPVAMAASVARKTELSKAHGVNELPLCCQQQLHQRAAPLLSRDDNDRRHQHLPIYDRGYNVGSFSGSRNLFGDRRFAVPAAIFVRNMSSRAGEGRGTTEVMNEGAEKAIEATMNPPDALQLQYLTDYINTHISFDWCGSIAGTAILVSVLMFTLRLPSIMREIKTRSMELKIETELIRRNDTGTDAMVARMCEVFNEYNRRSYTACFLYTLFVVPLFCEVMFEMAQMAQAIVLYQPSLTVTTLAAMEFLFIAFITTILYGFAVLTAVLSPMGLKMLGLPYVKVPWRRLLRGK